MSALIEPDTHWWNANLIKEIFNDEESKAIQSLPLSLTNQPDVQIWRGTAKGDFSISNAYHMANDREANDKVESSSHRGESKLWAGIWAMNIPNARKNFIWRSCHNLLPTKENLVHRKVIREVECPIYNQGAETHFHILWECPSAMDVWGASKKIFQKSLRMEANFFHLAESFYLRCEKEDFWVFVAIAQKLWFCRNSLIHEGNFSHPNNMVREAMSAIEELDTVLRLGNMQCPKSVNEAP